MHVHRDAKQSLYRIQELGRNFLQTPETFHFLSFFSFQPTKSTSYLFVVNSDSQNHLHCSKSRTEQLFTMAQSTLCCTTISSFGTNTLRFLQQYLCTASESSHIFTKGCAEPLSIRIHGAENLGCISTGFNMKNLVHRAA